MPTNLEGAMVQAAGFPAASHADWMQQVERVLGRGRGELNADDLAALYARILRTPTYDGFTLEPLYGPGDAPPAGAEGLPGAAPFVRGSVAARPAPGWDVRQAVVVEGDGAACAGRALAELENGAVSVLLDLRRADAIDAAVLDRALAGVHLDAAAVGLDAGPRWHEAQAALRALWAERGVERPAASGSLGADPIGEHASGGGAGAPVGDALDALARTAAEVAAAHEGIRAVTVDAARYHNAGASRAQELGTALATGVAYLRALCSAGMGVDAAAGQIAFRLAATVEQFPTIAALRAFRRLWARVAEVAGAGAEAAAPHVQAITSRAMVSRYDPWVNLLRDTVACFAAGVGGADVVTVEPYDAARVPGGDELGRRMARNTQSLLIDESGVGRVIDPAGGSYFVERLTAQLADAAWIWFQEIERAGGIVAALEAGTVQRAVANTWDARLAAIARRRDPITGVSEFPNIDEPVPASPDDHPATDTPFPALAAHRYAEPFERQRARADRHEATTGARPAVFLATLGTAAAHTARATFAKNLFEAAGIRAREAGDLGPDDDAGAAFAASGAELACICSSDALYAERAEAVARALADAGAARVYLAGRPGGDADALRAAGVHEFAFVGVDALDLLTRALDAAGVAP